MDNLIFMCSLAKNNAILFLVETANKFMLSFNHLQIGFNC